MQANTVKDWVTLYSDELYSWACFKTSDKIISEDLVQDTFLAALQNIDRFEGKSSPKTWLFSILNNKITDFYRKNIRSVEVPESKLAAQPNDSFLSHFFEPDGHWKPDMKPKQWQNQDLHLLDDQDFNQTLDNCIDKLPANWSAAIQLKYLQEKEAAEICQELKVSTSNYWQVLHRAKLQLRQCLDKHWFRK
jgi:RNA polymerase sigma-70 factor (TIGR02943 family)